MPAVVIAVVWTGRDERCWGGRDASEPGLRMVLGEARAVSFTTTEVVCMGEVARALAGAGWSAWLAGLALVAAVVFWPGETPYRRLLGLVRAWRRPRR